MKAIRFNQYGEPAQVLAVQEHPAPEPGNEEVRVRILASPINPSGLLFVRGWYAGVQPRFRHHPNCCVETNSKQTSREARPRASHLQNLTEQKKTAQACTNHQQTSSLSRSCNTGSSGNNISPQSTLSGWLLFCQSH